MRNSLSAFIWLHDLHFLHFDVLFLLLAFDLRVLRRVVTLDCGGCSTVGVAGAPSLTSFSDVRDSAPYFRQCAARMSYFSRFDVARFNALLYVPHAATLPGCGGMVTLDCGGCSSFCVSGVTFTESLSWKPSVTSRNKSSKSIQSDENLSADGPPLQRR